MPKLAAYINVQAARDLVASPYWAERVEVDGAGGRPWQGEIAVGHDHPPRIDELRQHTQV